MEYVYLIWLNFLAYPSTHIFKSKMAAKYEKQSLMKF